MRNVVGEQRFSLAYLETCLGKTEKQKTALCHCLEYCEKVDKRTQKRMRCPQAYTELRESLGACYTLKNRYADKIKRIIEQDLNCSNPP